MLVIGGVVLILLAAATGVGAAVVEIVEAFGWRLGKVRAAMPVVLSGLLLQLLLTVSVSMMPGVGGNNAASWAMGQKKKGCERDLGCAVRV